LINKIRNLGFTRTELVVIGFLLLTLIAGIVIKTFNLKHDFTHDYSSADKEFDVRVKNSFTKLNEELNEEQKRKVSSMKSFADSLLISHDIEPKNKTQLSIGKKININTALSGDIMLLPGVGEVTAERIIAFREKNGGFKKIEQLMDVKGIGEKKFEKLKPFITIE